MEEWRMISGFPKYEVSNKGRIRNAKTGRIMKPSVDSRGYKSVCLRKDGLSHSRRIHKLVTESFVGDADNNDVIHIDRDRSNNDLDNLQINTRSQNMRSIYHNGRKQIHRMKKIVCVETGEVFESITECAVAMNTSRQAVSRCVNNSALTNSDGYHFRAL